VSRYALTEIFDTIQGEGGMVGQRMVFVRFAGCNLWNGLEAGRPSGKGDCARWCDTDFQPRLALSCEAILDQVNTLWPPDDGSRWVCLTGGEPMLQVTVELLEALRAARWKVAVETNGTVESDLYPLIHHVTLSPKGGSTVSLERPDVLKVVLPGAWTIHDLDALLARHKPAMAYVQPQAGHPVGVQRCLDAIRHDARWRLSLQVHKFVGLP